MFDLRLPIGIFFAILGIILVASPGERAVLTTVPVNLYAGAAMLLFGGAMLWLASRKS
ncbi:MAG TPA: hypothetical protein VMB85_15135 [Bryobacteraceae bacterium]|jgi:hypothetical protein|nr:hypothetical protein [Bryobacteraceae bacterium]